MAKVENSQVKQNNVESINKFCTLFPICDI